MNLQNVRWGWLKMMYLYSVAIAIAFGLGILLPPDMMISVFKLPPPEPIMFGITGGADLSVGICALFALALNAPLKFAPVLFFQLTYKLLWLLFVILPILFKGELQGYGWFLLVTYLTFIVGDSIAIPFAYIFSGDEVAEVVK